MIVGILLLSAPVAFAAETVPVELKGVGIVEHFGATLPLDLTFKNEEGEEVALRNFFDGKKPVLLTLVYYRCPNLCGMLLNGLTEALKELTWNVGEKFSVVTVSFDSTEGVELARAKRESYLRAYGREMTSDNWHFLTGNEESIQGLAQSVGFGFRYDEDQKEFAHAQAIYVLTPNGKISRYLYGIQFSPKDLKLALLEASEGKIGTFKDRFLMFCYHYDPKGRRYSLYATNLMKVAGGITVIGVGGLLVLGGRREKKKV